MGLNKSSEHHWKSFVYFLLISRLGISTTSAKTSQKIRVPKQKKTHVSTYKGTGRSAFNKDFGVRAEGTDASIKSPSTPTETSSSEEETSSEEESEYEDDEEEEMPPPIDISTVSTSLSPPPSSL